MPPPWVQQKKINPRGITVGPSVAGSMCRECGVVVEPDSATPVALGALVTETGSRRAAVTQGLSLTAAAVLPPDACEIEWRTHLTGVADQPKEVIDSAFTAFRRAYARQPVSGAKARALVLVALLWAARRLHGNDTGNERYLLRRLQTPSRHMNKAFGVLAAAVTTPVSGAAEH